MIEDSPTLRKLSLFIRDTLRSELLRTGRIASEALFKSIDTATEQAMEGISITGGALYYAKWVNSGRKSGVRGIPLDVLIEWIRQKKMDLNGKHERSVAFAIQRSIKEKGIKPAPFIDISIDIFERSTFIENSVERIMSQHIDDQLQIMFKNLAV